MSKLSLHPGDIHQQARATIADPHLQSAYRDSTLRLFTARLRTIEGVPGWERLRDRAQALKREVMDHLDFYLAQFADSVERNGGKVHWAATAEEACAIVRGIADRVGARELVKAKTMLSEEIELNHALAAAGIRAVETDLGEFIIQLAGDSPAHIVAPAIHMTRHDVSDLFVKHIQAEPTNEPERLTAIARLALRAFFKRVNMGVSGANIAVAETGTVVLVENEGNIRMCTTAPRVHVALVGIEKLIPRFDDLGIFLRLLARSSTGQKLSTYTSLLTGTRRPGEDGPDEMHVVLVDNGRIATLADPKMREVLYCIRCGACLNACPVYRKIGGHAYGGAYSGPIGALVTPQLGGLEKAQALPYASSLCGVCREVCPVKINIPDLLLHLRGKVHEQPKPVARGAASGAEHLGMRAWAWVMQHPSLYRLGGRLARFAQPLLARRGWIRKLPLPMASNWTEGRDFPALAAKSFHERWKEISAKRDR